MTVPGPVTETAQAIPMTIGAFTAVAWYNCIELNAMIWRYFKKKKGLYFFSLLACSFGIVLHSVALLLKYFQICKNNYVAVAISQPGWYCMVTGQSLVLYSRLHLLTHGPRKIRWVLYMIIIDVFLFHVPTTVLTFGSNSSRGSLFRFPYRVMEQIEISAFCLQEFIISGLYVYYTWKFLKLREAFQRKKTRRVMKDLILINVLIILMDVTLLGTEASNHYEIQTTYKSMVYSVKLKLEFAVLNQLVSITRTNMTAFGNQTTADIHPPSTVSELSSTTVGEAGGSPRRKVTSWCCLGRGGAGLRGPF